MVITVYTMIWALIGIVALIFLYMFNTGKGFICFATKKEFLIAILISSILGMRQIYPFACILLATTITVIIVMYPSHKRNWYIQESRRRQLMQKQQQQNIH